MSSWRTSIGHALSRWSSCVLCTAVLCKKLMGFRHSFNFTYIWRLPYWELGGRVEPRERTRAPERGLCGPSFEHDACGVGFLADLGGRPHPRILPLALTAVGRMAQRGAVDADGETGDGAGVKTQIPFEVLREELEAKGLSGLEPGGLAVGSIFLPPEPPLAGRARTLVQEVLAEQGLPFLGWRGGPIREEGLGGQGRRGRPPTRRPSR